MNIMKSGLRHSRKSRSAVSRRGFSLVELLVVITIIMLLLGILMPAITRAVLSAYNATSRAAVTELSNGAISFYDEHKFYPGQKGITVTGSGATSSGSQVLGYCVFGMVDWDNNTIDTSDPEKGHVSYLQDKVLDTTNYILSDRNTPQAILYFVSKRGNAGGSVGEAFTIEDNSGIIDSDDCETGNTNLPTTTGNNDYWWNTTFGKATNYDTFLVIAPGMDGMYYSTDDLINK